MDNDQIGRLLVFASQIIVCPLAFIATGLILGTRMIWFFWLMLCICTALSCLIADKVYTSRTSPFAWFETFLHNFIHGIAVLINAPREAALLRMVEETQKEKYSLDEHNRRNAAVALMKLSRQSESYTPPQALPSYDLMLDDDWQSRDTSDMPVNDDEKAVTSFK